ELGGDHDLVADRGERLAHHLLVRERPVGLGGIEERHAARVRVTDERDRVLLLEAGPVAEAEAHAAETKGRDFEPAVSQGALLHRHSSPCTRAAAAYSSSPTCSIHSTVLPSCCSTIAMCVIAVAGAAPCQCFSPGGHETTSPGSIRLAGPPAL